MKVAELVALLLKQPQEADVFIHDADEGGLLTLSDANVWFEKGDLNYPFARVEVGGCYDERRVEMAKWCPRCEFPDSPHEWQRHTCGK